MPENNVFDLYGRNNADELFAQGIIAIKDIPQSFKLNDKQDIQRKCAKSGKLFISKENIKHFLNTLHPPLYFMDFETFSTAIPLYDGTRPYQQVPFQFSLHLVEDGVQKHFYFLASGKNDPREEFASELKKVIGDKGTIVTFNSSFEKGRLKEIAESFPKEKKWIENVNDRIVDLLIPFRNFHYYNPKQQGSASIKSVLPALIGKGYEDLEIAEGGGASLAFLDLVFEKNIDKKKLKEDLLKYCERDTEAMIWILRELKKIVE